MVFIYSYLACQGQQPSYSFRNISINQGLSQSSVIDIAQDEAGFLWFATQDGLNRYDGKDFLLLRKNFDGITTPSYSRLGKLVAAKNNALWLISSGGNLEKLDLYTNRFSVFTKLPDNTPLPPVTSFFIDRFNTWWIGTENDGLIKYNQDKKEHTKYTSLATSTIQLSSNSIKHIYEDRQQTIWIITGNGITNLNSKGAYRTYASNTNIAYSAITQDAANTFWIGTFGKGLFLKYQYDTAFSAFKGFNANNKLPDDLVIETILADNTGKIWVGTYGQGLFIINPSDSSVQHFISNKKNPYSLPFNDVLSIKEDKQGGIWIGTDGGGVSYYDKRLNNFVLFSNTNVPENISIEPVRSVTTDKSGKIWIGTSNGGLTSIDYKENRYQTFRFSSYKKDAGNYERIVALMADEEHIWIGSQGNGLIIMNASAPKDRKWFHPDATGNLKLPDHTIWCVLQQSPVSAWIGTNNAGLLLVDKYKGAIKQFHASANASSGILDNAIRTLTKINDSIICIGFEKKESSFLIRIQKNFLR